MLVVMVPGWWLRLLPRHLHSAASADCPRQPYINVRVRCISIVRLPTPLLTADKSEFCSPRNESTNGYLQPVANPWILICRLLPDKLSLRLFAYGTEGDAHDGKLHRSFIVDL